MNPRTFSLFRDVHNVTSMALLAMPKIPKRSKYLSWCYELLDKEERMPAWKYAKLKNRLIKFHSQV